MTQDQVELAILRRYVQQHKTAELADPIGGDRCTRELDIRDVLRELGAYPDAELDYQAKFWLDRLAPEHGGRGRLKRCSNQRLHNDQHRYHARAYTEPPRAPAWERIAELEARAPAPAERELEQKFRVLYSLPQASLDFEAWVQEAGSRPGYSLGALFVDIDDFKRLNESHSHSAVDSGVLIPFQQILRATALHRGGAYRHGGEEFLLLFPNHDIVETAGLAETLRLQVERTRFEVAATPVALTVSIGAASWPADGNLLTEVIGSANKREIQAKQAGKNAVRASD